MYKKAFSTDRLNTFKCNSAATMHEIINCYCWNIKLSKEIYSAINLLEVTLRNQIVDALDIHIKQDWILDNNIQSFLYQSQYEVYKKAYDKLHKQGKLTKGQLISELTFGFWAYIFTKKYSSRIWSRRNVFDSVFPNYDHPVKINRYNVVKNKLFDILSLRKRISHHEAIFNNKKGLNNIYTDIETLLFWLNEDVYNLLDEVSKF